MKSNNPYIRMLDIMRSRGRLDNPATWGLGKVVSISPLKVEYMGMILETDQLIRTSNTVYEIGDELVLTPGAGSSQFLIQGKRVM